MMKSLDYYYYYCYYSSSLFSESSFLFLSSFSISQSPRSGEHEVGSGIGSSTVTFFRKHARVKQIYTYIR
jgi:hypothetical protein